MRSNRKILTGALILAAVAIVAVLYLSLSNISRRLAASRSAAPVARPVSATRSEPGANNGYIFEAAADIPAGSIVTLEMLRARRYEGPSVEPFITNPAGQALGFITRVPIARGSLIRPVDDFIGHISETGIAGVLRPGTRAMVLPLANKSTLHDLVRIGNSVDVLAAFDGQESRSIVQDVRVVAVDVFGNDYPQVNAAMRGPYKATPRGPNLQAMLEAMSADSPRTRTAPSTNAPATSAADPNVPSETATPQPTIAPNTPRPDAALTLEVTPTQAARIQLAIASNAAMDFLVRPALPGNRSIEPGNLIAGAGGPGSEAGEGSGSTTPDGELLVRPVSVTRAQIAPYAERKKSGSGGASSGSSSNNSGSSGSGSRGTSNRSVRNGGDDGYNVPRIRRTVTSVPPISTINQLPPADPTPLGGRTGSGTPEFPRGDGGMNGGSGSGVIVPSAPSAYKIPIYADGKMVRNDSVLTPRE